MSRCRNPRSRIMLMRKKNLFGSYFQNIGGGVCAHSVGGFREVNRAGAVSLPDPVLEYPMTHNFFPSIGASQAYSYTRLTDAASQPVVPGSVIDFEGIIRPIKSQEGRFRNARRVENMLGDDASEDLTNAWWSDFGDTEVSVTANTLTFSASAVVGISGLWNGVVIPQGNHPSFSFTISVASGSADIRIDGGGGNATITATTAKKRYSIDGLITSGPRRYVGFTCIDQDVTFIIEECGWEDVLHQSDKTAGEYTSTMTGGAAIDYGCGAEVGVQYLNTTNGNTVGVDHIMDETGVGSPLPNCGYESYQLKEQECLWTEDLSNGHALSGLSTPIANGYVGGIDAWDLKPQSTADVEHAITMGFVQTGQPAEDIISTAFVKKGTARYAIIRCQKSGGDYADQYFDLTAGAEAVALSDNVAGTVAIKPLNCEIIPVKEGFRIVAVFDGSSSTGNHTCSLIPAMVAGTTNFAPATGSDVLLNATGVNAMTDHEACPYIKSEAVGTSMEGDKFVPDISNLPAAMRDGTDNLTAYLEAKFRVPYLSNATALYLVYDNVNEEDYSIGYNGGNDIDRLTATQWDSSASVSRFRSASGTMFANKGAGVRKAAATFSRPAGERLFAIDGADGAPYSGVVDDPDVDVWSIDTMCVGSNLFYGQPDRRINNFRIYPALDQTQLNFLTR